MSYGLGLDDMSFAWPTVVQLQTIWTNYELIGIALVELIHTYSPE